MKDVISLLYKIKETIKVLLWPILFTVSQYLLFILFMFFYFLINPGLDVSSDMVVDFINQNSLLILLIQSIIFIPLFYLVYKKYRITKDAINLKLLPKYIFIAVMLSSLLNFIIIFIKRYMDIPMINNEITFVVILGTGILGPIIEELLFRGIVYERLNLLFSNKIAFYLSIFIFAIIHTGGIFQILFAFIIGYYLTYIYRKYCDIRISIFIHIIVNMTSILVSPLILNLF